MIIIDHIKDGYEHSDFTAATIAVYLKKYDELLHFFCGKKHFDIIKKLLNDNGIDSQKLVFHEICIPNNTNRDYNLLFYDFKISKMIFKETKDLEDSNVVLFYTSTFLLYYLKLLCNFYKNVNIKAIIHGDLERIDLKTYSKSFDKNQFIQYLYALIFGLKLPLLLPTPKNLSYIVLSESIAKNAEKLIPSLKNKIIGISFPYFFSKIESKNADKDRIINFCVVGLSSVRKNIPYLKKLTAFFDKIYPENKNFSLSFAGKIIDSNFFNSMSNKEYVLKNTLSMNMISSEQRDKTIKNSTYTLITYQLDSYKLVANGSFMDSISFETPMIAIRNNYIEAYFKKYGNIGYLCDSYEELEEKVSALLNNFQIEEYYRQIENIRKIKEQESIENIVFQIP